MFIREGTHRIRSKTIAENRVQHSICMAHHSSLDFQISKDLNHTLFIQNILTHIYTYIYNVQKQIMGTVQMLTHLPLNLLHLFFTLTKYSQVQITSLDSPDSTKSVTCTTGYCAISTRFHTLANILNQHFNYIHAFKLIFPLLSGELIG